VKEFFSLGISVGNERKSLQNFNDNYVNLLVTNTILLWWRNPIQKGHKWVRFCAKMSL